VKTEQPESQANTYVVRTSYQAAYPKPWRIKAGDRLMAGQKASEWTGWLWCTNDQGKSRWVPKRYLERRGGAVFATADYDATELTVREGELVACVKVESGWVWCRNQSDMQGWVPRENLVRSDAGDET
jgi:hypothetical protein